jgi:fused signal recognition particle receptor
LGLPIHFVGIGEALDDLKPFDAELFVDAILQGTD